MLLCRCDCGSEKAYRRYCLESGSTRSCGCYRTELRTTHGKSKTRSYRSWMGMILRCHNKDNKGYGDYGNRGIKVCSRWRYSFKNFFADMGERPEGLSIDRINNEGNYESSNCRWATMAQQNDNMRKTRYADAYGLRLTLSQWGRKIGVPRATLSTRLHRGWPDWRIVKEYGEKWSVL